MVKKDIMNNIQNKKFRRHKNNKKTIIRKNLAQFKSSNKLINNNMDKFQTGFNLSVQKQSKQYFISFQKNEKKIRLVIDNIHKDYINSFNR